MPQSLRAVATVAAVAAVAAVSACSSTQPTSANKWQRFNCSTVSDIQFHSISQLVVREYHETNRTQEISERKETELTAMFVITTTRPGTGIGEERRQLNGNEQ